MPSLSDPVAIEIGGLAIRWYALFILAGIIAATITVQWLARRRGLDPEFVLDVAPWVIVAGIIGARLYYILLKWRFYLDHPDQIVNLRLGGLTIHGALAGGIIMFAWLCRRRGFRFLPWADLVIAAVPIGQAIGRWGNWANQEAFGSPSNLPWAVTIEPSRRPAGYENVATFHPTFLYEGLLDMAIAGALILLVLRGPAGGRAREGDALWSYFILYGLVRLAIESLRTDSLMIGPLKAAYWVSGGLIVAGLLAFLVTRAVWQTRRMARPVDHPRPSVGPDSESRRMLGET